MMQNVYWTGYKNSYMYKFLPILNILSQED